MIRRIAASIKLRRDYKCATCGKTELGTTERAELDHKTVGELCAELLNLKPRAANMPVGWASFLAYPHDTFKCPLCKDKP